VGVWCLRDLFFHGCLVRGAFYWVFGLIVSLPKREFGLEGKKHVFKLILYFG